MRGDQKDGKEQGEGRKEKNNRNLKKTKTRAMMGAGIKREVDCAHLVFEADCVGWLLCYHITLILPLLFVRELRSGRETQRHKEKAERERERVEAAAAEERWGSAKSACK